MDVRSENFHFTGNSRYGSMKPEKIAERQIASLLFQAKKSSADLVPTLEVLGSADPGFSVSSVGTSDRPRN